MDLDLSEDQEFLRETTPRIRKPQIRTYPTRPAASPSRSLLVGSPSAKASHTKYSPAPVQIKTTRPSSGASTWRNGWADRTTRRRPCCSWLNRATEAMALEILRNLATARELAAAVCSGGIKPGIEEVA